jgi:hypothetical protein
MALATVDQQPFRFLDLPKDIRFCIYENIDFFTRHVLDRTQSHVEDCYWQRPPKDQVCDSRVTFIRPHTGFAINLLATCHLICQETRQILKPKYEHCLSQHLRYIVDYSAALAFIRPPSPLRTCLALSNELLVQDHNEAVGNLLLLCADFLYPRRPTKTVTQNDPPAIELTITYQSGITCGPEVFDTMAWLSQMDDYIGRRIVVVYKSPLPTVLLDGDQEKINLGAIERCLLKNVPRDTGSQVYSPHGVFIRPLEETAFERHLEGLEDY